MYEIDEIDRKIIRALQKDGRVSNVEIARRVGMTEGTVRKRIDRLIDNDVIRVTALVNPSAIGRPIHTLIGLQVDMGALDSVIEQLVRKPVVCSVYYLTGEYDLVIETTFPDTDGLMRFLSDEIGRIPGIRKSSTSHVLRVIKSPLDWEVPADEPAEVLVVDDDPDFQDYCRTVLENEGFRVTSVYNGDEAIGRMRIVKPDVVVLDVMMQGILDGLDASRVMRSEKGLSQIPIIMVSSIVESEYAGMFPTDEYVPVNTFLNKPIDPSRLVEVIRRLITH